MFWADLTIMSLTKYTKKWIKLHFIFNLINSQTYAKFSKTLYYIVISTLGRNLMFIHRFLRSEWQIYGVLVNLWIILVKTLISNRKFFIDYRIPFFTDYQLLITKLEMYKFISFRIVNICNYSAGVKLAKFTNVSKTFWEFLIVVSIIERKTA